MADLKALYEQELRPQFQQELGLSNPMEVPRIIKITLNMGVGEAVADRKQLDAAVADMQAIAGQKPVLTKARKSIAGFKIRDACQLVARLLCDRHGCTSFWIA